jgi:hypothetical protein
LTEGTEENYRNAPGIVSIARIASEWVKIYALTQIRGKKVEGMRKQHGRL